MIANADTADDSVSLVELNNMLFSYTYLTKLRRSFKDSDIATSPLDRYRCRKTAETSATEANVEFAFRCLNLY